MDARSERRLVTCLFIDVVGSTDATVKLGPERMQRLLRDAFAQMSTTIGVSTGATLGRLLIVSATSTAAAATP